MLKAIYEGLPEDRYPLDPTLIATATKSDTDQANLALQYPYGQGGAGVSGFQAGVVGQLKNDGSGNTVVAVCPGGTTTAFPAGLIADSFVDCLKSGKCTIYTGWGIYETDQVASGYTTPAVNDQVASDTDGKLLLATTGMPVVGLVEEIKHNSYSAPLGTNAVVITIRLANARVLAL